MDFTFVCPTESLVFNDALPDFARINTITPWRPVRRCCLCGTTRHRHDYVTSPIPHKMQPSPLARSTRTVPDRSPRRRWPRPQSPSLRIPLLADRSMNVTREYGCLIEDKWISFRASYSIDPKGVLRPITMNDLPVVRSVDEALRLVRPGIPIHCE